MFDGLNASLGVALVAAFLLIVINAFYRVFVNQERAAAVKASMQQLNAEARKAPPERQKELMSQTLAQQRELMRMNMKPMLLSFAVVAILLPWLGAYYRDVDVSLVDGSGAFSLSANGNYSLSVEDGVVSISGNGESATCSMPCDATLAGNTWKVSAEGGDKVHISLVAAVLPALPLIGGWQLGWIWWYIIASIPLAIIIRAAYGIRS